MSLIKGDILQNRYRITSLLAQGGMAAIYRGWHTTLNIPIAIKKMRPQPNLDAQTLVQLREQFRQEAAILARLEHPNLVDVLDFFEEGDNSYLVMDMVAGESLADRVESEGALPERDVWKWASSCCAPWSIATARASSIGISNRQTVKHHHPSRR